MFPLIGPGVRYKMLAHRDHSLNYFKDETLAGEVIESLMREWYRKIIKWPWISWEIEADENEIGYYFWAVNESVGDEIRRKIIGEHPEMEIHKVEDTLVQDWDRFVTGTSLKLDRDYPVKIKTFINDIVDSQSAIVNSLSDLDSNERAMVQILLQPATKYQNNFDKALKIVKNWDMEKEREKVELFESSVYSKQTKLLGHCVIRLMAQSDNEERARTIVKELGRSFGQFTSEALNKFTARERWMHIKPLLISDWKKRRFPFYERGLKRVILNIEELSGLMRLPSRTVNNSRLTRLELKNLEAPKEIIKLANEVKQNGQGRFLKIGTNTYRMRTTNIYLNPDYLSTHLLALGGSGSGKSVFLQNFMNDISELKLNELKAKGESKIGFYLIDPHGELSKLLVSNLSEELIDHVNYICPNSKDDRFYPFNVFDVDFDSTPDSVSKNIAEVLKRIWPEGWGVRPDRNMLHAGIALQYCGEASIINVNRIFRDFSYCLTIAEQIKDVPQYEEIYHTLMELAEMMNPDSKNVTQNRRQHRELTDSTRNKLEHFSLSTLLSKATGTYTCGFRWREWMDEGKITILDLSKIKNEAEKKMYGSMALTMIYQAALTREELIEQGEDLAIHPIIADELPSFISTNAQVVSDMADRTRYVKVPLIGAAQGLVSQMPVEAAQAILRNFNSLIAYKVKNPDDASTVQRYFNHEDLFEENLKNTPENYAYMRLSTGRSASRAFSALMDAPRHKKINPEVIEKVLERTWKEAMDREEKVKKQKGIQDLKINFALPEEEIVKKTTQELEKVAISEPEELVVKEVFEKKEEILEVSEPVSNEVVRASEPEEIALEKESSQTVEEEEIVFQFKIDNEKKEKKEVKASANPWDSL